MPDPHVAYVMFDAVDVQRVATFWQRLLGLGARAPSVRGPYVFLESPAGLNLGFQRVDGTKTSKNRVHLDLYTHDLDETRQRVHELGGSEPDGFEAGGFLVMADPEGNEFCIIPAAGAALDERGRAHYLDG